MTVATRGTVDITRDTEQWADRCVFPLCSPTFRFLGQHRPWLVVGRHGES